MNTIEILIWAIWAIFVALLVLAIVKYKGKFKFWWQGLTFFVLLLSCFILTENLDTWNKQKIRHDLYNKIDQRLKDICSEIKQSKIPVSIQLKDIANNFFCVRYDADGTILDNELNSDFAKHNLYSENFDSIRYIISSSNSYELTGDYDWAKYYTETVFVEVVDIKNMVVVDTFSVKGPNAPESLTVKRGTITNYYGNASRHEIFSRIIK
jgi:hypothetical protein